MTPPIIRPKEFPWWSKGQALLKFEGKLWQANLLFDFLDRGFFIFINVENLVQSHQFKDFFDVITNGTKSQFNFCLFAFFAEQDQFSNHRRVRHNLVLNS